MKVMHVIHEYDYAEGMGRSIDTVARQNGMDNVVLCSRLKKRSPHVREHKVRKTVSPWYVAREARRIDADIVHFHGGIFSAIVGSITPLRGIKSVVTIYGWPGVSKETRGLTMRQMWGTPPLNKRVLLGSMVPTRLVAWLLRKFPVVTPDSSVSDRLEKLGVRCFNYNTATEPVDRELVESRSDTILLSMAGRAELTRGADVFMGVVSAMNARGISTEGVVAALPGPHSDEIKKLADGRRDITVIDGLVDLEDLFSRSHLVVLPFRSDYTTSPPVLVAEEALACGIPVVTSSVACMKTAVDADCALVLEEYSVKAYADAVIAILSDKTLYERMRVSAKDRPARAWNCRNVASETLKAYAI